MSDPTNPKLCESLREPTSQYPSCVAASRIEDLEIALVLTRSALLQIAAAIEGGRLDEALLYANGEVVRIDNLQHLFRPEHQRS